MIKFPRQHKIFRGEFQSAPFAAVFLLLLIFLLFQTSLVYIPGLPVELPDGGNRARADRMRTVVLSEQPPYQYQRERLADVAALSARLRQEAQTNRQFKLLRIRTDQAVTNTLVRQVVEVARELNLEVDLPGGRIDLPVSDSLVIATNHLVTLAINLGGQIYYQSQALPPGRVETELRAAAQQAGRPVTLLILADRAVPYELIIRAGTAARAAGIEQVLLATRPQLFQELTPP